MTIVREDYLIYVGLDGEDRVRAEILFERDMYGLNSVFLRGLMELNYHVEQYLLVNGFCDEPGDVSVYVMSREGFGDLGDIVVNKIVSLADVLEPIVKEGVEVWL